MASVRGQRLRALEQRNQGITRLALWLEANHHKFKGPVLGPLACEVTVADPLHAAYLEQQCQCAPTAELLHGRSTHTPHTQSARVQARMYRVVMVPARAVQVAERLLQPGHGVMRAGHATM